MFEYILQCTHFFQSYNVTLNLLSYLHKELDFIPWSSAYNGLKVLDTLMPAADNFDKYRVRQIQNTQHKLSMNMYMFCL